MDIYSLANIIIRVSPLGVSLLLPGFCFMRPAFSKACWLLAAVTELLGWLYSDSNAFLYNLYMLLLFHGYFTCIFF